MAKALDWESRIGRRVRLRDLHALAAVIQSGSMAKAAKELGVTQSAVSQMIADLEAALRVRLLDRSPRGVVATDFGHVLLRRSRAALDELGHGIQEIEFMKDHAAGQVRVGCSESVVACEVVTTIAELFLQRYPKAVLDVDDVHLGALEPLLDRKLDLVISRGGRGSTLKSIPDEFEVKTLFEDELVVAAGAKSRWFGRRKINLADLVHERWILARSLELHAGFGDFSCAGARRTGHQHANAVGPPPTQSSRHWQLYHHIPALGSSPVCRPPV
jgi:DNA-binding transcriptional LysR family regulator